MKPHRITFRNSDLELTLAGHKTATIRFSPVHERVKEGDALALCFGAYHKPTVLEAVCTRVLNFDLLEALEAFADHLESKRAEETLEPDESFADPEFMTALGASFSICEHVLEEAVERDMSFCLAIWFTLNQEPVTLASAA